MYSWGYQLDCSLQWIRRLLTSSACESSFVTRILHGNEGDLGLFPAQLLLCATPSIGLPSKLGENNAALPATNLVKIKSAICQRTAHLLFDESCANSSMDAKKYLISSQLSVWHLFL